MKKDRLIECLSTFLFTFAKENNSYMMGENQKQRGITYIKQFYLFLILLLLSQGVCAQSREGVKTSTDLLMFLPSAVGAGKALVDSDYKGLLQLAETGVTSVAVSYLLKYTIKKRRPDGSDNHSFPSNHTGVAFAGAAFLQRRYGWTWGAPAYAVATYVGWGRVYSKRHDTWDVLAGTAIGIASAYIYTRPFAKKYQLTIAPALSSCGGCGVYFSMNF